MQPFRLRKDARTWFKDLYRDKAFKIGFDAFYFCFIAGISAKRKENIALDETEELVAYFPEKYGSRGKLLVGLFLTRELEELGVTMDDRKEVHATIAQLVSPDAPNHLSDEGVREFNRYAHGGYDVLLDWFDDDHPRALETFLQVFRQKVNVTLPETTL